MTRLLLGNLESGTSGDEIKSFLGKYGFPPVNNIEYLVGDDTKSAVVLTFDGVNADVLQRLRSRIHFVHWKNHQITAQVLTNKFYE